MMSTPTGAPAGAALEGEPASPAPVLRLSVGEVSLDLVEPRECVVGRLADADLRVEHPEVSRRHARVTPGPRGDWSIHDLNSANGLFVDGRRVTNVVLRPGLQVRLGPAPDAPTVTVAEAQVGEPDAPHVHPVTADVPSVVSDPESGSAVRIGRAADNDVVVEDLLASRHHARATRHGDGFWIEDLDSLNGTHIDGRPIASALLSPGGLLTIGHLEFRVVDGDLVMTPQHREVSLAAHGLRVVLPGGKELLGGVDVELPAASMLAVIGPSGAGKSTLLGALTGNRRATSGTVTFDGRDLYANFEQMRHRIGLVPQDDVVHPQLTVRQALEYASRLRFPADLDRTARRARITEVVAELELTPHLDTRIDTLSGGQRKRTSVALELLTEPSLLFLDEPTSGLDPGLDKSVMRTLRGLADSGRTVVVVTHSVANLGLCDRVLLLAPGGKVAYLGPPQQLLGYFGREDYSDVFTDVAAHPDEVAEAFARHSATTAAHPSPPTRSHDAVPEPRRRQSALHQCSTLVQRHVRVLLADRSYALFMALLPIVLGALVVALPGSDGFGPVSNPKEPQLGSLLVVLLVGAAFMGIASSARDLVGERAIFRREKGVGLSPGAYLAAKLVVFAGLALLQSGVLVGLVLLLMTRPDTASALGNGALELYVATAATTFASACVGLLISAWASTSEQVMPLLVIAIMAQLVLCGGLIALAGQGGLEQLAWAMPSRWGFAAGASTVDVGAKVPTWKPDGLWTHDGATWWRSMLMLGVIAVVTVALTGARLARVGRER